MAHSTTRQNTCTDPLTLPNTAFCSLCSAGYPLHTLFLISRTVRTPRDTAHKPLRRDPLISFPLTWMMLSNQREKDCSSVLTLKQQVSSSTLISKCSVLGRIQGNHPEGVRDQTRFFQIPRFWYKGDGLGTQARLSRPILPPRTYGRAGASHAPASTALVRGPAPAPS